MAVAAALSAAAVAAMALLARGRCILTVSSLYPHCILTVFLQREVSAESCGGGRWCVVVVAVVKSGGGGGGWWRRRVALYPHCILTISPLYPYCIPAKRCVCGVLQRRNVVCGGGGSGEGR